MVENKKFRINQLIKSPEVRLIDAGGGQLGIMSINEALTIAKASNLDLVEISPNTNPPVCRIVNFSKFRYEMDKREKGSKKKQKTSQLKEIRIRPRIGEHDLEVKLKQMRQFILGGNKVQVTAMFSGREMQHKDLGISVVEKIKETLSDIAEVEGKYSTLGNRVFTVLIPKKK